MLGGEGGKLVELPAGHWEPGTGIGLTCYLCFLEGVRLRITFRDCTHPHRTQWIQSMLQWGKSHKAILNIGIWHSSICRQRFGRLT